MLYSTGYLCFNSGVSLYGGDGVSRDTLDMLTVDAVNHISSKFNVVILQNKLEEFNEYVCEKGRERTANSPISASSIPIISSSSEARRPSPGIKLIMKRMMQLPKKEYARPETESASWYPSWM